LEALAKKGHDVRDGTKVFGVNQHGKRRFTFSEGGGDKVNKSLSLIQPRSSVLLDSLIPPDQSSISSVSRRTSIHTTGEPRPVFSAPSSDNDTSSVIRKAPTAPQNSSNVSTASSVLSTTAQLWRPTSGSESKYEKKDQLLKQIVKELDTWCEDGSPGKRTAYLTKINREKVGPYTTSSTK
jgi:hypothetical protein